jgi:hypothetical protein
MSPKTATLPVTEPAMWRKLLAKVHPDADGDHELFVWATAVRESVCAEGLGRSGASPPPPPPPPRSSVSDRVPFGGTPSFGMLTWRALQVADDEDTPRVNAKLLRLLMDCETANLGHQRGQQRRGASYKQLGFIAYNAGMTKDQRQNWYRPAEEIPLSMRHASHIISRMGG